jgi:F0F1-type ATP synthase gamma subunit
MKFGHAYKDFLEHGGFPADWVASAISYQQLKKCIKLVKNELASLGLDPETLQQLLERAEKSNKEETNEQGLRYEFEKDDAELGRTTSHAVVRPKLLFLIDESTGEPVDARLSPETKRYIHELALRENLTDIQVTNDTDGNSLASTESSVIDGVASSDSSRRPSKAHHKLIEIPLTSDSQFFNMLQTELSGLAHLQDSEKRKIHDEIFEVGDTLVKAVDHSSRSGRADLDHWRRIFELYMDSRIFFNIGEQNHGAQQFTAAQERYNKFLDQAQKADLLKKFKRKESMSALQHFLQINVELLQNLRFQEINQTAMVKILKSKHCFSTQPRLTANAIPSQSSINAHPSTRSQPFQHQLHSLR